MKFIKNILEFIIGTWILWLPIIATIIVEKLIKVVTMEHIMTLTYILLPILIIFIIKIEIQDTKEERRKIKNDYGLSRIIK